MNKYIKAIRENICSICVDSNEDGDCTLNQKEICAVEHFLPEIVDVIHSVDSDEIKDYEEKLREKVCNDCRASQDGDCYLREDSNCSLDRYFALIVETVQKVDAAEI